MHVEKESQNNLPFYTLLSNMQTQEFLLFYCMLALLSLNPEAIITLSIYNCSSSSYTPNSAYEKNLINVLESLPANTNTKGGFYNTSAGRFNGENNTVYGSFLCRRDLTPDRCKECVTEASVMVKKFCPMSKVSIIWYDVCMLRYSDLDPFGILEKEPLLSEFNHENVANPDEFKILLKRTVNLLVIAAAKMGYAHREGKFTAKNDLYTMAQCRPDLPENECRQCLLLAAEKVQSLEGKIGGKVMLPSCFVRFEIYPFYVIGSEGKGKLSLHTTMSIVIAAAILMLSCTMLAYSHFKRRARKRQVLGRVPGSSVEEEISELHSLQFDLLTIRAATDYFSDENKLGEGGFGPVYKGQLPNGQRIAAKRLSQSSLQGTEEFRNEVQLVANLQHRNLVRLYGFSLEGQETLLIYEHVPNGSLDKMLFEPEFSKQLDWSTRHKIILGIAWGLLYLHKDSRLTIIHRDLKASNILLDHEMNPKISDFGMARMFCAHQTQASTNRIVGTFGYMSPEYLMFGQFSMKSDVFSYGVLLLEIITGKKNSKFFMAEQDQHLLGNVWQHWSDGTLVDVVDPILGNAYSVNEVIRCVHIGLLCVQDNMEDRPTMDAVVLMLSSDSISLPLPQEPFFSFPGKKSKRRPSSSISELSSSNLMLFSAQAF